MIQHKLTEQEKLQQEEMKRYIRREKWIFRIAMLILLVVVIFLFLRSAIVFSVRFRKYKPYKLLQENEHSIGYTAKLELTKEEWSGLRKKLTDKKFEKQEPDLADTGVLLSLEEMDRATEQYVASGVEFYTIFPETYREQVVVCEMEDSVILFLKIEVSNSVKLGK